MTEILVVDSRSRRNVFIVPLRQGLIVALIALGFVAHEPMAGQTAAPGPATGQADQAVQEARKIAEQAYIFAYPLVVVEMTRRATTRGGDPLFMNRLRHEPAFPDDRFRQVIRPNADTLYSAAWFDLSKEPVLLHVPDTKGRYYLMQFMDAWSETIASPGKRTTGTGEGWFALVGPGWKGTLPEHVQRIDCPTNTAWLIGRTQTNGPADFAFVHTIQQGYKLAPLSTYPKGLAPLPIPDLAQLSGSPDRAGLARAGVEVPGSPDRAGFARAGVEVPGSPDRAGFARAGVEVPPGMTMNVPPPVQVARMSVTEFFQLFAQLLQINPAHAADAPMVSQLSKIGIVAGHPFPAVKLSPEQLKAIDEGAQAAAAALKNFDRSQLPSGKTGWTLPGHYGRYGTNYLVRALTAQYFLGILPAEDAVYLSCAHDSANQPLQGGKRYTMHFEKGQVPPVKAFWSLTLYNDDGYFTANTLHRFAIGDRDPLKFNADGSLDLYIQHDSPSAEQESNWLPAPTGNFNLALRMYWPDEQVINGGWTPPAVKAIP